MHPDAIREFIRLNDLVEAGRLPEGAISRLCYMGHGPLHTYGHSPEDEEWKCVGCDATWKGAGGHSCASPEPYVTNYLRTARWKCRACAHEWDGEDGVRCPACTHVWGSPDGAPCTYCGKDKDEYTSELPEHQRIPNWVPGYYRARLLAGS